MVNPNVKVNVPGRSGFDRSFKNIFTTKVGTLTPMCSKLVIPGAKGKLKISLSAALPPLASDCFMRCDFKVEAFLVPLRLLYGGFESFLTGKKLHSLDDDSEKVAKIPRLNIPANSTTGLGAGSLADYLGVRFDGASTHDVAYLNIFKFLAYHRCYDDWYRSARIQKPVFTQPLHGANPDLIFSLSLCPYVAYSTFHSFALSNHFYDGVSLGSLRQRNWGDDYFTIARTSPQEGSEQSVAVLNESFTISSLRAANSLEQFAERSSLASPRLQDYVHAHFGANLNSGVAQRAILLGSASYPVYSKGVDANSTITATNNPFSSVGARYGSAFASGDDFVCDFEANEPSILMVIGSLVPEANYSSGITRDNLIFTLDGSQVDLPDPLLENTGNEDIDSRELTGAIARRTIFGYVPKNTWYKTSQNEVHGLLRSGRSLASFIPQRTLSGSELDGISSDFLVIPTDALDNVTAVTGALSDYGVWVDSFIDLKTSEPLSESAMPSLQDPAYEHGHSVTINTNGGHI